MKKYIIIPAFLSLLLYGCSPSPLPDSASLPSEFELNGKLYVIDSLEVDNSFPEDSIKLDIAVVTEEFSELIGLIDIPSDKGMIEMMDIDFTNPIVEKCGTLPTLMSDLTSGLRKKVVKFTSSSNSKLGLWGFGGTLKSSEVLLIVDFVQFLTIECSDTARSFGVGARLYLHIKKKKKGVSFELAKLAANVELNRASVTYTVSTIGIVGDSIIEVLPTGSNFDVENYGKVVTAVDNIIRLAKDGQDGVIVTPQLLVEVLR